MTAEQGKAGASGAPKVEPEQDEAQRQAAFRRAVRHSRRVRALKLTLPTAALLIAGSFAAYSYLSVPGSISFDLSESVYKDGKFVMANPKLDGYTKDSRPYSMRAARALQDVKDSAIIELEGIDAKLPVGGSKFATIGTERGIYDNDQSTLELPSPIKVETTDGMSVTLQQATLNMRKGNLDTLKPVTIKTDGMELTARAFRIVDHGRLLIFHRRVKMTVSPSRLKGEAASIEKAEGEPVQN